MPAVTTTVPAVVDALVALARTVLGSDFPVYDGPPPDDPPDEFLSIGHSRDDEESVVDGMTTDDGNHLSGEAYTVRCLLSVARGDSHPGAVGQCRQRAAALLASYSGALRADPTLGGVLTAGGRAELGAWSWAYGPVETGTVCDVAFDISAVADYLGAL